MGEARGNVGPLYSAPSYTEIEVEDSCWEVWEVIRTWICGSSGCVEQQASWDFLGYRCSYEVSACERY